MNKWSMEIDAENYVIFRGKVPISELSDLSRRFCSSHWIIDVEWGNQIDAVLAIRSPTYKAQEYANH